MNKITLLIISIAFLFVGYKNLPGTMSNGAPSASTGAPDEKHCATSGCHSDFLINTGTAELSASIENEITQYELGKTYPITVTVSDPGLVRFGFQVVVLKNSDNTNVGTIKLLDSLRTQIIPGYGAISDRKYITYTFEGSNAVSSGIGKWIFDWNAPETNEGPVTFYIASIAANNDGTDAGDYSYTKKMMLDAPPISWSVYPTITSGKLKVQCLGFNIESFIMYNSYGEKVFKKYNMEPGTWDIEADLGSGVYFISISQNGKSEVQKIIITR